MDHKPATPEEIAQAAVDDANERAGELAATPDEQYRFARSFLRFEPEALALLDQQRLLAQTVPGIH